MRICFLLWGLFLAGCVSPAAVKMQEACQAGDTQACSVLLQQRHAAWSALFSNEPQVYTPPPVQGPAQTDCSIIGNSLFCNHY